MTSFIWNIMGLIAALMTLAGVVLSFFYMRSEEVAEDGFTIGAFITSPGFGMIMLGLVMYSVSGRARKAIKKKREEERF